ncbi:signal peptidase I [Xylanimonas cellulosilytica DSM 15894]|uniref:Signal peptidase I n=1 Tax=Xylanimonas cellulosilytica (strain DSM 15894 / JCM 12276 / CECT 5975 / KCTC 9989 / LMG 20990 / NBRC 107835 / XIL07) TaxID=446471 RepID=D1BT14_XYLCX|nr:signal peptidase I [Xylanimonas cellulosilytica]ACZ30856.1 signal peptidase I [Xylanimonas cellulosilytica DSM 15894]
MTVGDEATVLWLTRVEGRSMEPTLHPGLLVPTRALGPRAALRRGDVVVAEPRGLGRRVVKRVVGLPGERLTFDGGRVAVDGAALDEPYATASTYRGELLVPAGAFVLLGDNRDASEDARSWPSPFVARAEIVGRLLGRRRRRAAPPSDVSAVGGAARPR